MRIALLSDIHGNSIALDAVLADIPNHGTPDAFWILGDLVALCPDPIGVLDRLATLPNLRLIRGNTDRYVTSGDRPAPTPAETLANPTLMTALLECANTFAWTQGMLTNAGWFDWLAALPLEFRETLPDGTRFLAVHASPGRDDGPGVLPDAPAEALAPLFTGCDAQLVTIGHTHRPSSQHWNDIHIVNPGAVSLTHTPDKQAHYALLDATPTGYTLHPHQVPYDHAAVIAQLHRQHHPAPRLMLNLLADPA